MCCKTGFKLPTSLHAMNRTFSFATFITARTTVCVIRYDCLAMKLGPDVEELKSNHWLCTLISDARICKRCLVDQTSIHIPTPGSKLTFSTNLSHLNTSATPGDCLHDHGTDLDLSCFLIYF